MTETDFLNLLHAASRNTGYHLNGDDAATIPLSNIVTTDQFIEGTHFLWSHMSSFKLGYKCIVQAVSDIAATGARPTSILTSLAWSPSHTEYLPDFIKGIEHACKDYETPLVGGDISRCVQLFYCDTIVTGFTDKPILKSEAQIDDIVAITGTLGDARAGWECATQKIHNPSLRAAYERPIAHVRTALSLRHHSPVHAMTDISDSLSKSVHAIAKHSKVGIVIDSEKIPISQELKNYIKTHKKNIDDYKCNAGEDYQLLVTLPANTAQKILTDHGLTAIGRVTQKQEVLYRTEHGLNELTEVGWDPFVL